jgi:hypothetical protein
MNTTQLVSAVMLKATGKVRNLPETDKKYQKILGIANMYIPVWQSEPNVDWRSLYDPSYTVGILSLEQAYEIDATKVFKVSDTLGDAVKVVKSGQIREYTTVPPEQIGMYKGQNCCTIASNKLVFVDMIREDDPMLAGIINVPVYLRAPLLTKADSIVPVDNPMWLVTICAAEYARNDILLQNQYSNLIAEANQLMQKMIENNAAQASYRPLHMVPGVSDIC